MANKQRILYYLRPWPLLFAALIVLAAGVIVGGKTARPYLGVALAALGCALIGSWIALMSNHGYTGQDDPVVPIMDIPPEDKVPEPSEKD